MERDCTHNKGIICDRSDCLHRCGWNPQELERRKQLIDGGEGLYVGMNGIKRLRIKKEEHTTDANRDL